MKLGVSYNVFDAEELLEPSILAIRDEVAHISVIYQEVSNGNNPCSDGLVALVLDLKKRGLVDKLYKYTPDLTKPNHINELAKRNLGLKIAKRRFCTHFMSMDTDEFYDPVKFAAAKKTLRYNGATSSAVHIQNYFKSPENLMMYKNYKLFVPFIYKIKWFKKFKFSAGFPVLVDPTRMIKSDDCHIFKREDIIMDHMTLVRKNIRAKLENSSAHQMFRDNGIDEYVKYFENWDPSQPAYRATDFSDIAPIKVVPDKYNIKKFL